MSALFQPIDLGSISLQHRVVMAPLTRMRSSVGDVPNELMTSYYSQRASPGGLIISEATVVAENGRGYLGAPGIYTDEQAQGWKKIVDAVHERGGRIVLQLWHVGRTSHRDLQPNGQDPVAPSAVAYDGVAFTQNGWPPVTPARSLALSEIAYLIDSYRNAAIREKEVGFDGVEVHAANGYLIDQFPQDSTNLRKDIIDGSIENRARFLLEVLDAVTEVWGGDRVGVRLSPDSDFNAMADSDALATFGYVAQALNRYSLVYLHIIEPRVRGNAEVLERDQSPVATRQLSRIFNGPIVSAGGFNASSAEELISTGDAAAVAFGRAFIANPDLPLRLRHGHALNAYDRDTFYGGDERGYVDYPSAEVVTQEAHG